MATKKRNGADEHVLFDRIGDEAANRLKAAWLTQIPLLAGVLAGNTDVYEACDEACDMVAYLLDILGDRE